MNFPSRKIKNLRCNKHATQRKSLPLSKEGEEVGWRTEGGRSPSQRAISKLFLSTRDRISGFARDFHARSARCRINVIKIFIQRRAALRCLTDSKVQHQPKSAFTEPDTYTCGWMVKLQWNFFSLENLCTFVKLVNVDYLLFEES